MDFIYFKKKELHVVFHLYFISLILKFQYGIRAIVLEGL